MDTSRVSACSYPLREKDPDYALGVIAAAGFRKVDLLGRLPHFSATDPSYRVDELQRLLARHGVQLANIGSYCGQGFSSPSKEGRDAATAEMRRTLEAARRLGARSIRVVPGDGKRASLDALVPYFREAAEYAEKLGGVYMGIENHGGEISGDPEACAEIGDRVGSRYFGILYEPANLMAAGVDYQSAFEVFRDWVVHIHVKDGAHDAAGKWQGTMLGDGVLDLKWIWEHMESTGFDGAYALEFEVEHLEPVETGYRRWFETWRDA